MHKIATRQKSCYTAKMNEESIKWSAPEYDYREHASDWYWMIGIITVSASVALIIMGNMLLSIILLVGIGTLIFHASQKPKYLDYEIMERGIYANNKFYDWDSLESFWIIEKEVIAGQEFGAKLLLISKKALAQQIVIPLGETSTKQIRELLLQLLDEEPQQEPFPERIMRKLGF